MERVLSVCRILTKTSTPEKAGRMTFWSIKQQNIENEDKGVDLKISVMKLVLAGCIVEGVDPL